MKIKKILCALPLFFACAISPLPSWAWGLNGHRIVGHIAEMSLTPEVKASVREIAKGQSLADISTWLDEQRRTSILPLEAFRWHFDNIPVCESASAECSNGNCAQAQMAKAIDVLRTNSDMSQKEFSLRVLVHLVGDIHQPLHTADNGDMGGNQVRLANRPWCFTRDKQKRACNLHEYWDTTLVKKALSGIPERDYAVALGHAHPLPDNDSASPDDWIAQSHELGRDIAYGKLDGFACAAPKPADLKAPIDMKASPYYDALARLTIERQLAWAGHRLGALLNKLLTSPPPDAK